MDKGEAQPSGSAEWFGRFLAACLDEPSAEPPGDDAAVLSWLAARELDMPEAAGAIPFAALWWPGVRSATEQLMNDRRTNSKVDQAWVAPSAMRGLQLALLARLSMVSGPTLLQVMSDDLTFGQRLLRRLGMPSQPSRGRYARFCAELANGRIDVVSERFPALANVIGTVVRQWHEATAEMLARIERHRGELATQFGIDASASLTGVMTSAGDQHNDGRAVAVLGFGEDRVVYKPRDVRLERLWADVLATLAEHGVALRAVRTLAADDGAQYGFAEFIAHVPSVDDRELATFFRNAGRTLAVLHALSATDCHHENLIAHRDQLVLIDAEALFETRNTELHALEPSETRSLGTVMDVGLLPAWTWLEGEQRAIDISALGATPETMGGRATRAWHEVNTDAMHRGPIDLTPASPTSMPTAAGVFPDLAAHTSEIVNGFERAYGAIVAARDQLTAQLRSAAGQQRRLIQRATYVYASLLFQSLEPEALQSLDARGLVLERLALAYRGGPPQTEALLQAEQQALARLDVPLFETDLRGTRTRWFGGELAEWPGDDALAGVLKRLAAMNDHDMQWQAKLIRSAVAARNFTPGSGDRPDQPGKDAVLDKGAVPALARRIHGQVAGDSLRAEGAATWMTLALLNDGDHANVQRIGTGLYDGVLGVSAYLFASGNADLANAALTPLLDELQSGDLDRVRRQILATGVGWSGAGGYLRALSWMRGRGHIAPNSAAGAADAVIGALTPDMLVQDKWLDLMNGVAGLVGPLHSAWIHADAARRLQLAALIEVAANHLLQHQRDEGGWITLPGRAPLTGLAHGASGIALALARAYLTLGEQRYLDAAERGLAYEASTFDAAVGNWPDFREGPHSGFMLGWCAGAPGIALTRMRLLQLLPDHPAVTQWEQEMEVGAVTTASAGLLERDHLCCGNTGRAAILATLGVEFGRDDWLTASQGLLETVAARTGLGLPRSFVGVPASGGLEVPGLMTGLAGQGLLLDHADPEATHQWVSALLL